MLDVAVCIRERGFGKGSGVLGHHGGVRWAWWGQHDGLSTEQPG